MLKVQQQKCRLIGQNRTIECEYYSVHHLIVDKAITTHTWET